MVHDLVWRGKTPAPRDAHHVAGVQGRTLVVAQEDRTGQCARVADRAGKAIATVAEPTLGALGLVRRGRSRTWIDDHGWWLVNVEFQPSQRGNGCYPTVGTQHLWVVRDHLTLENMERPLGPSTFVTHSTEDPFLDAMQPAVAAAAEAVLRRRTAHSTGKQALEGLARGDDDLNAGIAAALLGDDATARSRLTGGIHPSDRALAASYLGLSPSQARSQATSAIAETRARLNLAPADTDWP